MTDKELEQKAKEDSVIAAVMEHGHEVIVKLGGTPWSLYRLVGRMYGMTETGVAQILKRRGVAASSDEVRDMFVNQQEEEP